MRRRTVLLLAALSLAYASGCASGKQAETAAPKGWGAREDWVMPTSGSLNPADFVEGVDNPYWPLEPGATWTYRAATSDGTETTQVEVLGETRQVMGIACTVVRDVVSLDGEVIEDTRDWYAQDRDGNVWYMGEDVDNYENGELKDHEGAWEAGVDGARPGIKMWAKPRVGGRPYFQEYYHGQAEDLGRDLRDDGKARVPAGEYDGLLVVEEWNPLEPDVVERKYYERGVGTVKEETTRGGDEVVELTRFASP